ncbi:hypothetical protein CXB51_002182 [Gossypium anomalum]|uniref:RNase H type-1 domain-containing protein n=1 Tax=Gossypium anomalum TaxID=47600 RepID=A0A8J6DB07_9ROSI|nr:hypothetical protein CXB51_002182 [Gossypium anomalum]
MNEMIEGARWCSLFAILSRMIWKNRNDFVFKDAHHGSNKDQLASSLAWAHNLQVSIPKHNVIVQYDPCESWRPPQNGWIKLNSEATMDFDTKGAASGGVLRDSNACWIVGYAKCLGFGGIFQAAARALLEGLISARNRGFRKIEVECDHALLIRMMCSSHASSHATNTGFM